MDLVSKLVQAFPNGGANAGGGYLGALAATLVEYPRIVATKCCDPVRGVSRETRFLPTVADVVGFCERETTELRKPMDRHDRLAAQVEAAQERAREDDTLAKARAGRLSLDQLRAKHGPNWGIATGRKPPPTMQASREELIAAIGQEAFDALPDAGHDTETWQKLKAPKASAEEGESPCPTL